MAFSFGTSGATPSTGVNPLSMGTLNLSGSTPQAKALNGASSGNVFKTNAVTPAAPTSYPAAQGQPWSPTTSGQFNTMPVSQPTTSGMLTPPTNQPVASHTVNNADGSSVTQKYLPPQDNSSDSSSTSNSGTSSSVIDSPPPGTANGNVSSSNSATFPGIIGSLTAASQQGSPAAQQYTAQTAAAGQGNEQIGQSAADIAADYGKKIALIGQEGANAQAGDLSTGTTPVAVGNSGIIAQNVAAQQGALASGESAALQGTGQQLTAQNQEAAAENEAAGQANTSQGLTQSGLNQAGTLTYPATLSASSGQYLESPTGDQIGGGSTGGLTAYTNFSNAMANNSVAQEYGAQGVSLSNNISQMSGTANQILSEMGLSGANWQSTPVANQVISTYMKNQNPTAAATIQQGLNETSSYISQILSTATGQTPTAVTEAMQSVPLNGMSPIQLDSFLQNVQNYAASRLAPLQQTATAAEAANGVNPSIPVYSGNTVSANAMQGGQQNSTGTAVAGSALSAGAGFFQNLLSELGGAVSGATAGAGAGAAESLFSTAAI